MKNHTSLRTMVMAVFLIVVWVSSLPTVKAQSAGNSAAEEQQKKEAREILAGRTWQLVQIASMNDTTEDPDEPGRYTLQFGEDDRVQIRADCNRATGTWTSTAAGQLRFGPLAATRAQCPPGSLSQRYLAQFPWVRSYVLEGGHLFLATMADGSIIEFEPVELPLAATVLGEKVRTNDPREMQEIILTRLFDRYARENGIEVSGNEIDTFVANLRRGKKAMGLDAEDELSKEEKAQLQAIQRDMAFSLIRQWKLNRALYRRYGGRIISQQLGPEPLDAYRQYLEERQAAGDFSIERKAFEEAFWRYFTTDSIHTFYTPGSKEEEEAFALPPWERLPAGVESNSQDSPGEEVPAAAAEGGPLNWQVSELSGRLNLRAKPSTTATILDRYPAGTILANLGCQRRGGRVWCDVQKLTGGPRGYVAADFLTAAVSPNGSVMHGPDTSALRAGRGEFDATGTLPCAQHRGQPMRQCEFGVARLGGGYATVVVTRPDGRKRAIFFQLGVVLGADTSQADGYPEVKAAKEADLHLIRVGDERYEIPDAVIFGG